MRRRCALCRVSSRRAGGRCRLPVPARERQEQNASGGEEADSRARAVLSIHVGCHLSGHLVLLTSGGASPGGSPLRLLCAKRGKRTRKKAQENPHVTHSLG